GAGAGAQRSRRPQRNPRVPGLAPQRARRSGGAGGPHGPPRPPHAARAVHPRAGRGRAAARRALPGAHARGAWHALRVRLRRVLPAGGPAAARGRGVRGLLDARERRGHGARLPERRAARAARRPRAPAPGAGGHRAPVRPHAAGGVGAAGRRVRPGARGARAQEPHLRRGHHRGRPARRARRAGRCAARRGRPAAAVAEHVQVRHRDDARRPHPLRPRGGARHARGGRRHRPGRADDHHPHRPRARAPAELRLLDPRHQGVGEAALRVSMAPVTRRGRLSTFLSFVKFEHTLFALPFAYGGMLLAAGGWPGGPAFRRVTLAMVGARTAAMAASRVMDARIAALNPRTAGREIPSGKLTERDGWLITLAGVALLVVAGALLNRLTLLLLPVALAFLIAYPYLKRFTWACHLWLGVTIGAAAAGGYIAVTGACAAPAWALWLGVGAWVAGFDVVYGVLDLEFDRAHGVHSVPARFGVPRALVIAAALHLLAFLALVAVPFVAPLGWPYWLALAATGAVLAWQHLALRRRTVGDVLAAFNANLVIGSLMLAGIVLGLAAPA